MSEIWDVHGENPTDAELEQIRIQELVACATILKDNCKGNFRKESDVGCDCPFSVPFNNGYMCALYGYPKNYEVNNGED